MKPKAELPVEEQPASLYSKFSHAQRITIITLVSITGLLSPLSSVLYTPAIPRIANDLGVSISAVNLTITSYLIFQGLSPTIWSSVSDSLGRRQLYIVTLSIYIGACTGLSISNSYVAILILRAMQATGSASTSALGAGVIGDLIHVSQRGGFMGNYSALAGFGTAFGPVLGGIFAQYTGWHGIFIFLLALSATLLLIIILLMPETLRSIVGDGSTQPSRYLRPPLSWLHPPIVCEGSEPSPRKITVDILGPLRLLKEPEIICCLLYSGICYTVWQMSMVATSTLYARDYQLGELAIGLTYISNGVGSLCGSIMTGKILDHDYKHQLRREASGKTSPPTEVAQIERARILSLRLPSFFFIASTIAFGWAIQAHAHISVSIILAFFVGGFDTCILATFCKLKRIPLIPDTSFFFSHSTYHDLATLVVDLFESNSFAATAAMNLSRCILAAAGTSTIEPMINALNPGWTFTILGCICGVASLFAFAEYRYGHQWRLKRRLRESIS